MTAAALFEKNIMDAELEKVSGGSVAEFLELRIICKGNSAKSKNAWEKHDTHLFDQENVQDYLREELGIRANLNGSRLNWFNPFGSERPAEYTDMKTGKAISHQEVVRRAEAYVKSLG